LADLNVREFVKIALLDDMSKRKRESHHGEDSYQQLKTHVGPKEISCNSPLHMCAVYGRYVMHLESEIGF